MQSDIALTRAPATPQPATRLSVREAEVLFWIGEGKSDWEIGAILGVTSKTVGFHATNLRRKLGACNRVKMIRCAIGLGLMMP